MSQSKSVSRRKFIGVGAVSGIAAMLPVPWTRNLTAEILTAMGTSHTGTLAVESSTFRLPARPIEKPLRWGPMADAFDQCVMDPKNGVLRTRPNAGQFYFTSALEADEDGGMTTFAPVVLGKILRGDNVSNLLSSLSTYFNEKAGIFLDGSNATLCEYWYLMNINAMAAAITRIAMGNNQVALGRVRSSADRLIELAHQISYNFNDQGYKFDQRVPFTNQDRFRQPDTVGGYAYVMLIAYDMFQEPKYLEEARIGIKHYDSFLNNPWYEIPSGAMACLAAARLSLKDPTIDAYRALVFTLDSSRGAMQIGTWNGREVNGLMQGFHSEPPGEAYSMESMVVLPYLLPIVRYRPEFANVIGRYAVNVCANLRWFFPEYLPASQQSRPELTPAVPYERIDRLHDGLSPYASGDYKSHRSIYGGAYSLWWGALVQPTNEDYILKLDASSSDFLAEASYPTYLYYNSLDHDKVVSLPLNEITKGIKSNIYDLSNHQMLRKNVYGSFPVDLPAESAKVLIVLPAGVKPKMVNGTLAVSGIPIDYSPKA